MQVVRLSAVLFCCAAVFAGCASYKMGSRVPQEFRLAAVPVFENASGTPEAGSFATQAVLEEMLRDGTFRPTDLESATLKVQGRVTACSLGAIRFNRNRITQTDEYRLTMTVEVTAVEKASGRLVLDRVPVSATTTFTTRDDLQTGLHDGLPRVSAALAQNVVALLNHAW